MISFYPAFISVVISCQTTISLANDTPFKSIFHLSGHYTQGHLMIFNQKSLKIPKESQYNVHKKGKIQMLIDLATRRHKKWGEIRHSWRVPVPAQLVPPLVLLLNDKSIIMTSTCTPVYVNKYKYHK